MSTPENLYNEPDRPEITPIPEKATDIEIAQFLINHIDNPCEVEVAPDQIENIRGFYIRQAKGLISGMTNEFAIDILQQKIEEYKN